MKGVTRTAPRKLIPRPKKKESDGNVQNDVKYLASRTMFWPSSAKEKVSPSGETNFAFLIRREDSVLLG